MSLGRPDLYIAGRRIAAVPGDPLPALAGLTLDWGTDNPIDIPPASTLSGQLLVKGGMPDFLDVGAEVGLIDPATARCLFAGKLQPLKAVTDPSIASAHRVSFSAASPISALEKHNMIDLDWTVPDKGYENSAARLRRLQAAMPRGWTLEEREEAGPDWIFHGDQRLQSVPLLSLIERYARGNNARYSDTSTYVPGSGLRRRLTITKERSKYPLSSEGAPAGGAWRPGSVASGTAALPLRAVSSEIEWEKTPEDLVTAVQVTTWGKWLVFEEAESEEHEWPLDFEEDTSALINTFGLSTARIETDLSPQILESTKGAIGIIVRQWVDTKTAWRPTSLQLPDSRRLDSAPLLNLLAVDTRSMAAVSVPGAAGLPGLLRAYVLAGRAVWDGKKWTTDLTLGRTT